jgi:CAI-1 autoinducer synthase
MASNIIDFPKPKRAHQAVLPQFVERRVQGYYQERVQNTWGGGHIMRGRIPDGKSLHLSSNDYLSIAKHREISEAMLHSIQTTGNGVLMSGIFLHGDADPLLRLEKQFAQFTRAEASVLCQSGYAANTGLLQAIADSNTPVYIDMLAHMSLWDGIHCANAKPVGFVHNEMESLVRQLKRHGPGIILVDSVYSTNGSIAPLETITTLAEEYNCVLVVDESHSLGTHGPHGAGMVVELGLENRVHFRTASLAKAFAGRAGLITCSSSFNEYFKFEAKPAIFSSTLLPHEVAGLAATLCVIEREDWRRESLHRNASRIRLGLSQLGYNLNDSQSQIVSLESGTEEQTIVLRDALEARGIFGSVFCAPATPKNRAIIRLSIHAQLTPEQIDHLISVCEKIRPEVDMLNWPSTRRLARGTRPELRPLEFITTSHIPATVVLQGFEEPLRKAA